MPTVLAPRALRHRSQRRRPSPGRDTPAPRDRRACTGSSPRSDPASLRAGAPRGGSGRPDGWSTPACLGRGRIADGYPPPVAIPRATTGPLVGVPTLPTLDTEDTETASTQD